MTNYLQEKLNLFNEQFSGHSNINIGKVHYPFGMVMPGRSYSAGTYRFGFNGKENDGEVKGAGNEQDYGMRIYDPRLGKFFSVDPLTKDYPELTPYQFASNTPIQAIDIDGLEAIYFMPSFQKNLGAITFHILTQTSEGYKKVQIFKNTDPNIGHVNSGVDMYIVSVPFKNNEQSADQSTIKLSSDDNLYKVGEKLMPLGMIILEARSNPSGEAMKVAMLQLDQEIIMSNEILTTIAAGRDICLIRTQAKENVSSGNIWQNLENIANQAKLVAHEIEHGNEDCSEKEEHWEYNGVYGKATIIDPNSRAQKQDDQINEQCTIEQNSDCNE